MSVLPKKKDEDIEVVELPEETLLYDVKRNRAYCLNRTAALVWRHCDGRTTVSEMTAVLQRELGRPADDELVHYALRQLRKDRLLRDEGQPAPNGHSRRQFIQRMAMIGGGAIMLPVVVKLLVPPSTAYASHQCHSTTNNNVCCPIGAHLNDSCNGPCNKTCLTDVSCPSGVRCG